MNMNMNMNTKIRNLWVAVIMLLLLNLVTVGTIIYHNLQDGTIEEDILLAPDTEPINGKYFRYHLNFDENQMNVFRKSNGEFRKKANELIRNIAVQKNTLFKELQNQDPNQEKIKEISSEIGSLHTELKIITADFYMTLNAVCNEEQKIKMKNTFFPLFKETPNTGKGCGNGNGMHNNQN